MILFSKYFLLCFECIKDAQKPVPDFLDEIIKKNLSCIKFIKTPNNQIPLFNGSSVNKVEKFAEKLEKIISCPILFIDERLSSKPYKSRKNSENTNIHEKSACLILDDFLSLYRNSTSEK